MYFLTFLNDLCDLTFMVKLVSFLKFTQKKVLNAYLATNKYEYCRSIWSILNFK